ncbi:MAG: Adenylate cyclase, partial [Cyanobacteria bacterium RYN_339]|nr:Adenylate cyclase [Cyanobacteria bacterium RYN_339]
MAAIRLAWQFDFAAPPALVWPFVADTNRMNLLAGMPPVRYETVAGARVGVARQAGMEQRWDEHPFTWRHAERHEVVRTYHGGPLRAYRSSVTLTPHGEGTRLEHVVELEPRSALMAPLVSLGTHGLEAAWRKAYGAVDACLKGVGAYPFAPSAEAPAPAALAPFVERLVAAGRPEALAHRLATLVAEGSDLELQQLRPFALADRWGEDRHGVLELCLEAVRVGLLEPRWSHMCPRCRGPKAGAARLAELAGEAGCEDCGVRFSGTFDRTVELAFRPMPAVRAVEELVYCVAGPGATPHIVFQGDVPPGKLDLALDVEPGTYRLRVGDAEAYVVFLGDGEPVAGELALDALRDLDALAGPRLALTLANPTNSPLKAVLEREAWSDQAVTAAYAGTLAAFRDALGSEGLTTPMPVSLLAFLVLRARGTAAVYADLGPAAAHAMIGGWLDGWKAAVAAARGTAFKGGGDTVLAAFYDPLAAAETALAILELAAELEPPHPALGLAIGADAGACVALGPGVDFAGAPVERALAASGYARPGELVLGEALAGELGVQLLLGASERWSTGLPEQDEEGLAYVRAT